MKDKIELTRAAFERWWQSIGYVTTADWQSLCEEAEKPEKIEAWAVSICGEYIFFTSESDAKNYADHYKIKPRIIKLVEEVGT